jgi:AcrR family transcriptional regulator
MGTRERKEREKEARRNAIVEAAKTVFFEKGFQGTTMDQIAEAAELSKGSLYIYFPSKEELYVTVLVEGLEILHQEFSKAVEGGKNWEQKLRDIGKAYYSFNQQHKNYFNILFLLHHGELASHLSNDLYQRCFEKGLSCLNFLSQAIKEGINDGEIELQDPMELSVILWGSFNGIILLYEEEEHKKLIPSTLDHLIQKTMDLMMEGLKKR